MPRVHVERRELPGDLLRLLETRTAAAEYTPPLDVVETESAIELLLDVPGVQAADIEIVFAQNVILITGTKRATLCQDREAGFHMGERERHAPRRRTARRVPTPRRSPEPPDPHSDPLACASCSSAISSASRGARSRAARFPRWWNANRSTSSSRTS